MKSEMNAIAGIILVLIIVFLALIFFGNGNEPSTGNSVATGQNEQTPGTAAPGGTGSNEVTPPRHEVQPEPDEPEPANVNPMNRPMRDLILVTTPLPFQKITSPLIIEGKARGFWFFEGDFPITLSDSSGKIIVRGHATAKTDWMTDEFVQFSAELRFTPEYGKSGSLSIRNNNPSDLVQNNREVIIPISFSDSDTVMVKVFFSNSKLDQKYTGSRAFTCQRVIPQTPGVARAALEELLKGPTAQEKDAGFFTSINEGVKIQRLSVINGVARVDFDEQMEKGVSGSARVGAIRAEVTQTLKQFSTVRDVIISINGRTADILQP